MKRFLFTIVTLLLFGNMHAQDDWQSASTALTKYESSGSVDNLEKAKTIIDKVVTGLTRDPEALMTKGMIYTACSVSDDSSLRSGAYETAYEAYSLALLYDKKVRYRHIILKSVFDLKISENQKGIDLFSSGKYGEAVGYYKNAKQVNDLELQYPRIAPLDSTILYSIAMNAKLAGNTHEAVKYYEKLVALDYDNKEIYTSLAKLYAEQGQEAKVQTIEKKFAAKYPKK